MPRSTIRSFVRLSVPSALLATLFVATASAADAQPLQKIRIEGDKFFLGESKEPFVPWGFNYLGEFGKLVEDSWDTDWARVERDFREMKKLGGNVVRVHLQFGTFMKGPNKFDKDELGRLRKMCDLAQETGLYLDVTGLNLFRLGDIPAWYDELPEAERWDAQARWWSEIAKVCAGHPAVFCYDLMNEPVIGGAPKEGEPRWVGGELGGFHFVQRLSIDPGERKPAEIAEAWVVKLTSAIRKHDSDTPITVGAIPWANTWPNAKPLFYSPEVGKHLDFVCIHLYPTGGKIEQSISAVAVYDIGKPLVIEEIFPLGCSMEEFDQFVEGTKDRVDGWVAHYFGHTIEEHRNGAEPHGSAPDAPFEVTVAGFLEYWRDKGKEIAGAQPEPAP